MEYSQCFDWQTLVKVVKFQIFAYLSNPVPKKAFLERASIRIVAGLSLVSFSSMLLISCTKNEITSNPTAQAQVNVPRQKPLELSIISYAVTRPAYANIIPLFQEKWKHEHNQDINFRLSNGGSRIQTNALINGLPADVIHMALDLDITRIQKAGLIKADWQKRLPNNAIISRTVGVIMTRSGNPKNIKTWADLAKPGVTVVTADPKTSGIARWNFLAFWGSVTQTGGNESQALDFVTKLYRNVPVLAKDARDSTDIFLRRNQGDVVINYENELLQSAQEGLAKDTISIIPDVNISIDGPVAVVDKYVDRRGTREVAEAFVQFLYTPEAQREFAKVGFRPFDPVVAKEFATKYPPITKLFTVQELGGWNNVQNKFFKDGSLFDQIQMSIRTQSQLQ